MLKHRLLAVVLTMCLALCSCQVSGEVENQAYVLVLALGRLSNGRLELTARVPKIGNSASKDGKNDVGDSPYLTFSVSAPSWTQCLDALQWATPRRINLSHIEMIVISRELAMESSFPDLINQLADTSHLYTTASLVICEGSARSFLEAGKTIIGTRMSAEIRAMLKQYAAQGYIPTASLADAFYAINSIYGDPVAIWGYTDASRPNEMLGAEGFGVTSHLLDSPMTQHFCGAALFQCGQFVHVLESDETMLLGLLRGRTEAISVECQEGFHVLIPNGHATKGVRISGNDVVLSVSISLSATNSLSPESISDIEHRLKDDIESLIMTCQRLKCDPFGFSESASKHFPTVDSWLAYPWRDNYAKANLETEIHISRY